MSPGFWHILSSHLGLCIPPEWPNFLPLASGTNERADSLDPFWMRYLNLFPSNFDQLV